jgi:LuxR family maltose regulon positive regulatory protein
LAEPLSSREFEVLHLLVETSLSAEQIAERLYVSVHTVRSHIKSIYGKLGVHGRMEAASRARELNLV